MSSPTTIDLKNIEPEDIGDVLQKVEKSFGFKFDNIELKDVKTFGELCDIITNKVEGDNSSDCTTQQAFYKLRAAILTISSTDKDSISVDTKLEQLFPRKFRRQQLITLNKQLGFETDILRPKHWGTLLFVFAFFASLFELYYSWQAGLIGIAFSVLTYKLMYKFGKELDLTTVGEFAEKIAKEHYKQVRRDKATINRIEVAQKVKELFMTDLDLEEQMLAREATLR